MIWTVLSYELFIGTCRLNYLPSVLVSPLLVSVKWYMDHWYIHFYNTLFFGGFFFGNLKQNPCWQVMFDLIDRLLRRKCTCCTTWSLTAQSPVGHGIVTRILSQSLLKFWTNNVSNIWSRGWVQVKIDTALNISSVKRNEQFLMRKCCHALLCIALAKDTRYTNIL